MWRNRRPRVDDQRRRPGLAHVNALALAHLNALALVDVIAQVDENAE